MFPELPDIVAKAVHCSRRRDNSRALHFIAITLLFTAVYNTPSLASCDTKAQVVV